MRQQTRASKEPAEKVVQDIRRATRKHYSAEEKMRRLHHASRRRRSGECRSSASEWSVQTGGWHLERPC